LSFSIVEPPRHTRRTGHAITLGAVDHEMENYILSIEGSDTAPVFGESCNNAAISERDPIPTRGGFGIVTYGIHPIRSDP